MDDHYFTGLATEFSAKLRRVSSFTKHALSIGSYHEEAVKTVLRRHNGGTPVPKLWEPAVFARTHPHLVPPRAEVHDSVTPPCQATLGLRSTRVDDSARCQWLARYVFPYEGEVRSWLLRHVRTLSSADADDLVQEAYAVSLRTQPGRRG